jgi:asparagine synthase (glutamine-hydrolysing)
MLGILPEIIRILDEPFADGSMLPTYFLSRHTRKFVTVALSGDGGDELFAGYPTYQAHKVARWIPRLAGKPLSALAGLLPVSDENISFDFKMRRFAAGISYEPAARNQIWLGAFERAQKRKLFAPDVAQALNNKDEFKLVRDYWSTCDSKDYLNRLWNLDMRFYLQDDILVKVDRMSMANSLETRAPFLDHELVEFVCSLPPSMKLKGFTTKYILKEAAKGLIPDSILKRPKKGFGAPIGKWLKKDLKEIFLDTFSEQKVREAGLFNWGYIHRLFEDHQANRRDNRKFLWALFIFESWRQTRHSIKQNIKSLSLKTLV